MRYLQQLPVTRPNQRLRRRDHKKLLVVDGDVDLKMRALA